MEKNVKMGVVLMITLFFSSICAYAQDLITTKDGTTIQAKILEVDKNEIKYKKYGYLDGPTFVVSKKDVAAVQYADGTAEAQNTRINVSSTIQKAEQESFKIKYQGEVTAGFGYGPNMLMKLFEDGSFMVKKKLKSYTIRPIFSTVHGVRFSRYFFIGAGFDFQYSASKGGGQMTLLPVFGNIKGYLPLGRKFDLYTTISLGANITLGNYNTREYFESASVFGFGSSYFLEDVNVKGKIFEEYGLGFRYRKLNFSMGFSQQLFDLHPILSFRTYDRYNTPIFTASDAGDSICGKLRINSFYFKIGVTF